MLPAWLDPAGDGPSHAADRDALGHLDRHTAGGIDELAEPPEVDERVVADRQAGHLLDCLGRRLDTGVLDPREELGTVGGPGVHAVEVAAVAVEPVGELLVHHGAGRKRHVGQVAGEAQEYRAPRLLVDAGDCQAVRPHP